MKGSRYHLNGKPVYGQTKYNPKVHPKVAEYLCEHQGFRDKDLAEAFDISARQLYVWKWKYPEFAQALEAGKAACDMEIMESVKDEIMGYYREETVFVEGKPVKTQKWFRGNAAAGIQWLRIRMKEWAENEDKKTSDEEADVRLFLKAAVKKMQEKAREDAEAGRAGTPVQLDYRKVDQDGE